MERFLLQKGKGVKNRDFERCTKANKRNDERLQYSKILEKFCKKIWMSLM